MADRMTEKVARKMFKQDHDEPWAQGEGRTKGIYLNNAEAAMEACHFEELVEALKDVLDETVDESAVRRARAVLAKVEDA